MAAGLILGVTLVTCIFLSIPIAISIGIAVIASIAVAGIPPAFLVQNAFTSLDSFALMAIPFFILAGALMETGGLSRRLIDFANSLMHSFTGGLALVTLVACLFFAALSGSSPATVAAIGSIMFPAMVAKGYNKEFSAAVSASGGGLGILIPPSIPMIIYAIIANASVSDMFLAGFAPGFVAFGFLVATAIVISKRNGYQGSNEKISWNEVMRTLLEAKWAIFAPFIILGGIYGGIFTPTESAVIAVLYAFIIGTLVYKELRWPQLKQALISTSTISGAVLIILGTASAFGKLIKMYHIPDAIAGFIVGITDNKTLLLLLIGVLVLIIGTFMETLSILIILTPLFLPVVTELGVNPIHFGIILIVAAEIGLLTPPVGINLFVASGISGIPIERISIAIIPFVAAMIFALAVIILVPQISLFLPEFFR
ncbi:TRAP transporter large permease [Ammoniphilus sp. YIM 78166]|uniref:TRAP transporter large permease n=1 Tax=Ammoniphilus sp. YIM 78166 TaxID=1644106 RepID=UPI00106F43C6|nr:TRAP transporter large permease [Ammoniphilus sp. YIM 78166]